MASGTSSNNNPAQQQRPPEAGQANQTEEVSDSEDEEGLSRLSNGKGSWGKHAKFPDIPDLQSQDLFEGQVEPPAKTPRKNGQTFAQYPRLSGLTRPTPTSTPAVPSSSQPARLRKSAVQDDDDDDDDDSDSDSDSDAGTSHIPKSRLASATKKKKSSLLAWGN